MQMDVIFKFDGKKLFPFVFVLNLRLTEKNCAGNKLT